jgi:hypothetical protein
MWTEYCNLVGQLGNSWAVQPLVEHYRGVLASRDPSADLYAPAMALAKIGDPDAIPRLIGLLAESDTRENRYAVGYFALRELTGVAWDESHDAQWWNDWWSKNSPEVLERSKLNGAMERYLRNVPKDK